MSISDQYEHFAASLREERSSIVSFRDSGLSRFIKKEDRWGDVSHSIPTECHACADDDIRFVFLNHDSSKVDVDYFYGFG